MYCWRCCLFVRSPKQDGERSNVYVDAGDVETLHAIKESSVDVLRDRTTAQSSLRVSDGEISTGTRRTTDDKTRSTTESLCDTSPSSRQSSSSTSTGDSCLTFVCSSTVKSEPSDDSTTHPVNKERCHDNAGDVITSSRCEECVDGRPCIHFTASCPTLSYSHRRQCPYGPSTTVQSTRRRAGLSRLRRTELRRRSRISENFTQNFTDGDDDTALTRPEELSPDVGRTAPSHVSSVRQLSAHSCVSSTFNNTVRVAITAAEVPLTASTCQPVLRTSTTMTTARQSSDALQPSVNEKPTDDITSERHGTKHQCKPTRLLQDSKNSTEHSCLVAAGTVPATSSSTTDASRTSVDEVAPPSICSTADRGIFSLSNAVRSPRTVSFTPLIHRIPLQMVVRETAIGRRVMSPIVVAQRGYTSRAVSWRLCDGGQRDDVMWVQTLTLPALRCALTALKYNTVTLISSPAVSCYTARHVGLPPASVYYPQCRLLCYPSSPCV